MSSQSSQSEQSQNISNNNSNSNSPNLENLVDMRDLLSLCVGASIAGGRKIREVAYSGNMDIQKKSLGDTDFVTRADKEAQAIIVGMIRGIYGADLSIVAEEGDIPVESISLEDIIASSKTEEAKRNGKGRQRTSSFSRFRKRGGQSAPKVQKTKPSTLPDFTDGWKKNLSFPAYPKDDLLLYIDPLDGTYSFVNRKFSEVTVLIGICYEGRPIAGVIHCPFLSGRPTLWGVVGIGVHVPPLWGAPHRMSPYLSPIDTPTTLQASLNTATSRDSKSEKEDDCAPEEKKGLGLSRAAAPPSVSHALFNLQKSRSSLSGISCPSLLNLGADGERPNQIIATSSSKYDAQCQAAIELMQPCTALRACGAGFKFVKLLCGDATAYVYPRPGMSKWDVCAGEGIVLAAGGVCTDRRGNDIKYIEKDHTPLEEGLIAAISEAHHADICSRICGNIELIDKAKSGE